MPLEASIKCEVGIPKADNSFISLKEQMFNIPEGKKIFLVKSHLILFFKMNLIFGSHE